MVRSPLYRRLTLCLPVLLVLAVHPAEAGESRVERSQSIETHPFPVPSGLEAAVEFWKQIFTRYSGSEVVFYDRGDHSKIYKVVNLEEEIDKPKTLRSFIRSERRRIARERGLNSARKVLAQRGIKERFVQGLRNSERHMAQMQAIFRERGLPVELAYLPLIESAFQVDARSHAGAVGLWQFIYRTGKRYLRISSGVDERKDPLESTRAAAELLRENYETFGRWPLAVTAYNYGRAGIQGAVERVGSTDLVDLIERYDGRRFGVASKNFYAEFVAAVEVAQGDREYLPNIEYVRRVHIRELRLERPVPMSLLLRFTGVSRREFMSWNPALSQRVRVIPNWYRIKVPAEKLEMFSAAHAKIVNTPWIKHQVARGETLSHIARVYRVSIHEIQSINGLSDIHFITAGQQLKLPQR